MIDRLKLAVSVQILRHLSLYFIPIWKATAKKEVKPVLSTYRDSGSISNQDRNFFILQFCAVSLLLFAEGWRLVGVGYPVGSKRDHSVVLNVTQVLLLRFETFETVHVWTSLKKILEWTVGNHLHISPNFLWMWLDIAKTK